MCTNQRLIHSKYMRRPMFVKCGHCPSCMQEKANRRVSRIHDTYTDDFVCFMVALTYSQHCAPYIFRSDVELLVNHDVSSIPIYRDCVIRKVRKPSDFNDYNQVYKITHKCVELDSLDFVDSSYNTTEGLKDLAKEEGKIGICFYKDYQDFAARFRINLKRHYNYENELFVYACSEYGVKSFRPHFHLLIFGRKADKEKLRNAIYESWPFSNLRRFKKAVQESYRSASYVASYVNCDSKFPKFFKIYKTPKHSYSKGFGTLNPAFQLNKILEKIDTGFIAYSVLKNINGVDQIINVPIPAYVINRFFPKFKGMSRVSVPSLLSYFERIRNYDYEHFTSYSRMTNNGELIPIEHKQIGFLVDDEISKVWVRLNNAYLKSKTLCPDWFPDFMSYAFYHQRIWSAFNSTLLRFMMEDSSIPLEEKYDNLDDYVDKLNCRNFFKLAGLNPDKIEATNPNLFRSVRNRTAANESYFYNHIKHRNVSNGIYLSQDNCEL